MYLTLSTQDNSRKRRSSDLHLANGHSAKRSKPDTIYNAFTDEQHAVIENTASFFQIHPSDLSAAIGSLRQSSTTSDTYSQHLSIVNSFQQPGLYTPPVPGDTLPAQPSAMGNEWESSSGSSQQSFRDGVFGFNATPAAWSNCFSSLLPSETSTTQHIDSNKSYAATPRVNRHASIGDPLNPYSYSSLAGQAYPPFDSSSYIGTDPEQHDFDFEERTMCNGVFACDTSFQTPTSWTSSRVQLSQPPSSRPNMIYSRQASSASQHFNLLPPSDPPTNLSSTNFDTRHEGYLQNLSPSWETERSEYPMIDLDADDDESRPKRGPFKDPTQRAQTAQTRKDLACVRCKMQRTRCLPDPFDPRGVCLTCKRVSTTKIVNLPCLRYKIPDTRLFRVGYVPGHVWSNRWKSMEMNDVSTWSNSEVRSIEITQDYSPNPLVLRVRRFTPVEGDMLSRKWKHGSTDKSVRLPPYAIESLKEAERSYREYINKEGKNFFPNTLDQSDSLVWETYSMAIDASNHHMSEQERVLLTSVLRLWVAVRMICRSERICGKDTLGMPQDLMDQSSPMHGKIPIPPVMGAQIEVILIQGILIPLRAMILEQLQKLVLSHKPQNWFCIYLCTFILLHNTSLVTKQDIAYARKHGLKRRFAMVEMIKELHMGANILLAYFHYCCRGFRPFSLDWDAKDSITMADLDQDQVKFIQKTASHVKRHEANFRAIRDQGLCDNEHFFIAQLYEEDWAPRSVWE